MEQYIRDQQFIYREKNLLVQFLNFVLDILNLTVLEILFAEINYISRVRLLTLNKS